MSSTQRLIGFTFLTLVLDTTGIFASNIDSLSQIPCESPSLPAGSFHVVVAAYEEKHCFKQYLWKLGLTNALVIIYRRVEPERPLGRWHGPCGMVVQEKLLLPNHGKDLSAFHSYVFEYYDNPPLAVLFLHGHGPHAYHTDCHTIVGRARLFYRGLVSPYEDGAEFARHMVTLTRFSRQGDPDWMHVFPESPMSRRLQEKSPEEVEATSSCANLFSKWSVNATSAGFWSCCATFILPWDRILWYPKGFYREALQHSVEPYDDHWTSRVCWEFVVYAWYQEPAVTPSLKKLYLKASDLALQYDLRGCTDLEPPTC
ncbi:hypothetical protein COCSUDRAFT_55034 [Coccomyxa subellipsoidea C-169]|uniref:Uncharacterized protein n=1 Tax=Coccomyxa subellipsoidea (strain C-169) TaxID=574566 RepID=I0YI83_COCSC|nr:hypothetical protein COCSUDRAFT_55034 [Coccomyxa subellipsoidea C-169]EIE18102.1 hypothetical protein COCSUDRAFT_55034 [Coccomyxa subellipsoidea C-169]|eukprot:XP_005642646.1 hypothetical protein COCSUDRAFT_55034 [Coccomyxa subellipsoidea C-169]